MQAILIIAHKNFNQVFKLAKLLKNKFNIYIHFDKKMYLKPEEEYRLKKFNINYIQNVNVHWGGWSISEATIKLMKLSLKDPDNDYFHIISGEDWPCVNVDKIYDYYENNDHGYMLYSLAKNSVKSGENQLLWQKYYFNYDKVNRRSYLGKIYHRFLIVSETMLHVNKFKKYNFNMEIYQGPNWMDLPRSMVEYCIQFYDSHPNFKKVFVSGYCPDEFWVQTILCNSKYKAYIVQNYHRYIVWKKRNGSYPAILDERDYSNIISGDYHFMRKVNDNISKNLIDNLNIK